MIEIVIPAQHYKLYDEEKEEFLPDVDIQRTKLQLEHSLISLRKWEQHWHKPFLVDKDKTKDEVIDYMKCMTINHVYDDIVYDFIPSNEMARVIDYISDPMTATTINGNLPEGLKDSNGVITAETIYYWMIELGIPIELEKWHLNQLFTMIRVVSIKRGGSGKKDAQTAAKERALLNKTRRAKYKTRG